MIRTTHPHGIEPRGYLARHRGMPRHDHRQRSRKKMLNQPERRDRYATRYQGELVWRSDVNNKRIVGGAAFRAENFPDRTSIQRIRTQTIHGFGWKCRDAAAPDQ